MRGKKKNIEKPPKVKYHVSLCERVKIMARSGMIDEEMFTVLGISSATWYRWEAKYPEFREAIKKGKEYSDSHVEDNLYKQALGYEVQVKNIITEDILVGKTKEGQPITYTKTRKQITSKFVQGNVLASIYILNNRQRGRWGNRGPEGQQPNGQLPDNQGRSFTDRMLVGRERLKARKEAYMAQLAMEKETAAMLKEAEVIETGVETQSTSGGSSEQ